MAAKIGARSGDMTEIYKKIEYEGKKPTNPLCPRKSPITLRGLRAENNQDRQASVRKARTASGTESQ
jgi:hypothetical protein